MLLDYLLLSSFKLNKKFYFQIKDTTSNEMFDDGDNFLLYVTEDNLKYITDLFERMEVGQYQKTPIKLNILRKEKNYFLAISKMTDGFQCTLIDGTALDKHIEELLGDSVFYKEILSIQNGLTFIYDLNKKMIYKLLANGEVVIENKSLSNETALFAIEKRIFKDDLPIFNEFVKSIQDGTNEYKCDLRIKMEDSKNYLWHQFSFKKKMIKGTPFLIITINNINESHLEKENLIQSSLIDPLTKILNKKAMESLVKETIEKKNDKLVGFAVLDIDNFKKINDTFGHLYSDKIIVTIVEKIKEKIVSFGKMSRFGGDEFMILFDNARDLEQITNLLTLIQNVIQSIFYEMCNGLDNSCTIGLACAPKDGNDYKTLFVKADKALYRGKNQGKGQVIIYDEKVVGTIDGDNIYSNFDDHTYAIDREISDALFVTETINKILYHANLDKILISLVKRYGLEKITIYQIIDHKLYIEKQDVANCLYLHEDDFCVNEDLLKKYLECFNDNNIFICNHTTSYVINDKSYDVLFQKLNIKACIDCNFGDRIISFATCSKKRSWENTEIDAFVILANMINNNYLV